MPSSFDFILTSTTTTTTSKRSSSSSTKRFSGNRLKLCCSMTFVVLLSSTACLFPRVTAAATTFGRRSSFIGTTRSSSRSLAFQSHSINNNNSRTTTTSSSRRMSSSAVDEEANKKALLNCPTIPLRNGQQHPAIMFGTYKVGFIPASASSATSGADAAAAPSGDERTASECVSDALKVGYRGLECAEFYGNEVEVGKAIKDSGLKREELFLCSKVWTTTIEKGPEAIRAQLDTTLKSLGVDYLDLYLIHWPVPGKHVEAYKTLEAILKETPTKIKGIGVSNYAIEDIQELMQAGCTEIPLVNQIEINPFLYRQETIAKCQEMGIVLQSYRSLRDGKAMNDEALKKIASKHSKSVAQILGRWCIQKGFVYMPKSVKVERMKENSQVFDFTLDEEDLKVLDNLTTPQNLSTFQGLYRKCVNRDTTKDGTMDGVKMDITIN